MQGFEAELVAGGKAPYTTWTFVVFPDAVVAALGAGARPAVRGTVAGVAFRGTIARGEGVYRMPLVAEVRAAAGVAVGDVVAVAVELDPEPRPVEVPAELQAVLDEDAELAGIYAGLATSCRRAWAQHVGEAKRPATRARRAEKARTGIRARRFPGQEA